MPFTIKEYKKFSKNNYRHFVLGGDIGGTNTNLGIFGVKSKKPKLLALFHFDSKKIKGLHYAVNEALEHVKKNYGIPLNTACFGVAGVLSSSKEHAKITNARWDVSKKMLLEKTQLKKILLVNDFEAIGYGISILSKRDIMVIKRAQKVPKAPILVIGAGTGLGKAALIYNENSKSYAAIPSEAGHSDFAAQTADELALVNFIKKRKKISANISYEQVLSGQGLSNIYLFLRKSGEFKETKHTREIDNGSFKPELISKYRGIDKTCKETFKIFKVIYARFAKNFALDCLAWGGVYIAGGIAPKNREIFDREFVKVFEQNYKVAGALRKTPVYLILNHNVGLLGVGLLASKI